MSKQIEFNETARRAMERGVDKLADTDTVDLLTGVISEFEKHAWFLRASLE